MMTAGSIRKLTALIVSVGFFVAIWLPLAESRLGLAPERESTEKRALAELPALRPLAEFPRGFEAWYNDHFGFRNYLIRWHNAFKAKVLLTAPNSEVVIGKDGWLYFAGQLNIELYRAAEPMSVALLDGWELYLTQVREFLADRDIEYLLVIAPTKPTIHPEHLPDSIFRVGNVPRIDQFFERLAETEVDVLDLRAALLAATKVRPTYSKTDTHWSAWGSFSTYCALMERLVEMGHFATIHAVDVTAFKQTPMPQMGGDITALMGLEDLYPSVDMVYQFKQDPESIWQETGMIPGEHAHHTPMASVLADKSLPRLVMYHDSFGPQIAEFLPTSFSRAAFYWQYELASDVIAFEQPDIVIQEIGERALIRDELSGGDKPFPIDELVEIDFEARRAFRASSELVFTLADAEQRMALARDSADVALAAGAALLVTSSSSVPRLMLPDLRVQATDVMLRIDLETEAASVLTVRARIDAGEAQTILERRLVQGRNIAYVRVTPATKSTELTLVLGDAPGSYQVRALDLRAVLSVEGR